MDIKKYIQAHKTMTMVIGGVLATVVTASAVYFSSGGLFSGNLGGLNINSRPPVELKPGAPQPPPPPSPDKTIPVEIHTAAYSNRDSTVYVTFIVKYIIDKGVLTEHIVNSATGKEIVSYTYKNTDFSGLVKTYVFPSDAPKEPLNLYSLRKSGLKYGSVMPKGDYFVYFTMPGFPQSSQLKFTVDADLSKEVLSQNANVPNAQSLPANIPAQNNQALGNAQAGQPNAQNANLALQNNPLANNAQAVQPGAVLPGLPLKDFSGVTCKSTPLLSAKVGEDVIWTADPLPPNAGQINFTWQEKTGANAFKTKVIGQAHIFKNSYPTQGDVSVQVLLENPSYKPRTVDCGSISIIEDAQINKAQISPIQKVVIAAPTIVSATAPSAQIVLGKDKLNVTVKTTNMSDKYTLTLQIDGYQPAVPPNQSNQTISGVNGQNTYSFMFDGKALDDSYKLNYISADSHFYNVFLRDNNGKQIAVAKTGYFTTEAAPAAQKIDLGKVGLVQNGQPAAPKDFLVSCSTNAASSTKVGASVTWTVKPLFGLLPSGMTYKWDGGYGNAASASLSQGPSLVTSYSTAGAVAPVTVALTASGYNTKTFTCTPTITIAAAQPSGQKVIGLPGKLGSLGSGADCVGTTCTTTVNTIIPKEEPVAIVDQPVDNSDNTPVEDNTPASDIIETPVDNTPASDLPENPPIDNPQPPAPAQIPGCADYYDSELALGSTLCKLYDAALEYAKTINVMTGNADGTFGPNDNLQRDQSAKIALELGNKYVDGTDYCNGVPAFPDVPLSAWSSQYLCAAKQFGIVTGYGDGLYKPSNPVTNSELVAIMSRMLKANYGIPAPLDASKNYQDVPTDAWYVRYAAFFYKNGLIVGEYLYPTMKTIRIHVVQIIYMMHILFEKF